MRAFLRLVFTRTLVIICIALFVSVAGENTKNAADLVGGRRCQHDRARQRGARRSNDRRGRCDRRAW